MINSPVLFDIQVATNGKQIAFATLNAPKSLNALSLPMIELLHTQLALWLNDDAIAVIVLQGAGEKAFCAGGDVVSIYHDLLDKRQGDLKKMLSEQELASCLAVEFFTKEYQLDQLIHHAKKPILAWADGYVMGGGIGLMAGASHRVVTETTLMAMPEVTIGLYPDVGASWFLNQMPKGVGLFLGLTGMTFNGQDAQYLALADFVIERSAITAINQALLSINWQVDVKHNQALLSELLSQYQNNSAKVVNFCEQQLKSHLPLIEQVSSFDNINAIYHAITSITSASSWFHQAQEKLKHGSPLSLHLIYQQLIKCQGLSLAQCFEHELQLSLKCCQHSEFIEGVRALLVDKDKQPHWRYQQVADVDKNVVAQFFEQSGS